MALPYLEGVLARCSAEVLLHHGAQLAVARLVLVLEVGALVIVLLQELPLLLVLLGLGVGLGGRARG